MHVVEAKQLFGDDRRELVPLLPRRKGQRAGCCPERRLATGSITGRRCWLTLSSVSDPVPTNSALIRRAYELWSTGAVEALLEHVFTPDIVLYDIPDAPDTGTFRGADEVAAHIRTIMAALGHMQYEVRSVEERGDYGLATLEMSVKGASSGVALTLPSFQVSRWTNGRMRELRAYLDADQAREEYERLSTRGA